MSTLSPRLSLRVTQKQVLTPSLVQMVTMLQCNRLELKDMINQELAVNPVLEETSERDEATAEEVQALLEAERVAEPSDAKVLELLKPEAEEAVADGDSATSTVERETQEILEVEKAPDSFDEIDYGSFFDDYLDPGFRSPSSENIERPSFDTFLASPVSLSDHLEQQLSLIALAPGVREAADEIIGNLDEKGYLEISLEEIASMAGCSHEVAQKALEAVQSLDPSGMAARDLRECLLLQLEDLGAKDGVAWRMVADHLPLVRSKQWKDVAKLLGRPIAHIETAYNVIRRLNPEPGLRYSSPPAQKIEPDVYIFKEGDEYFAQLSDEDLPQLRISPDYRRMIDKDAPKTDQESKDARTYIRERYNSALQLLKNIEQRKQTILKVCQALISRQSEMLDQGIDALKPMMIKDVAEEIGVHPSTVSRAVAGKYAHTPQGVFELRFFFSEAVQGPSGSDTPLLILKRKVKKMIEDEDATHPLTDEQITARLQADGIMVTRRTVAKYREDMNIPSTHQRRQRS